jgi:hypothetical protein
MTILISRLDYEASVLERKIYTLISLLRRGFGRSSVLARGLAQSRMAYTKKETRKYKVLINAFKR